MATARDIVKSTLRKIHVLGKGQELDADEANDALNALNEMLAVWSAEGDLIFTESKETFSLSGALSYTIGVGGDFDTIRPNYIQSAYVTQGDIDYPLQMIDGQHYSRIANKDTSSIPDSLYYDAGFPLAKIYLHPLSPSSSTLTLYSFKPLTSFAALDADFAMPEEYKAALIYNLAVWISPEYEREPSMQVQKLARHTKDVIQTQNKRNENFVASVDLPTRGTGGSIYEGYYS